MRHSLAILIASAGVAVSLSFAAGPAAATDVAWANLTSKDDGAGVVSGDIAVNGQDVGVTFSGGYGFAQVNDQGTFYWTEGTPAPYTGGSVSDAPPDSDIIALSTGGLKTITFDRPVSDVYLALISWNGNAGTFNQAFNVVSQGCGYWGCGTFTDVTPTSFVANGELHGVIEFTGTFSSVSFTDLSEYWHGIQIGIGGVAPVSDAPEPSLWALMLGGVGLLGAGLRRARARVRRDPALLKVG